MIQGIFKGLRASSFIITTILTAETQTPLKRTHSPTSVHRGSPNLQVKLENEAEIFIPSYKLEGSPDSLPYRKIWDVAFYNNKVLNYGLV